MNYAEAIKLVHGIVYAYTNILVLVGVLTFIGGVFALKQIGEEESNGMMQRQGSQVAISITAVCIGVGLIYFTTVVNNTTRLVYDEVLYGSANPLSWSVYDSVNTGSQETLVMMLLVSFFQAAGVFAMGSGWGGFQDAAEMYGMQRRQLIRASLAKLLAGAFLIIPDAFVGMFGPIFGPASDLAEYISQHRVI